MFQHCSYPKSLITRAPVATQISLPFTPGSTRGGALFIIVSVVQGQTGSLDVQILGSFNNVVFTPLGVEGQENFSRTVQADGFYYFEMTESLPPHLRVDLTAAGGFDGLVSVGVRSSDVLITD